MTSGNKPLLPFRAPLHIHPFPLCVPVRRDSFKTTEDGDTFFLLALFSEYRDIQNLVLSLMAGQGVSSHRQPPKRP